MTTPATAATASASADRARTRARAIADRRHATQQTARIIARQHQRVIDAEVRETRRVLVREVLRRGGTDTVAFCDPDFLTVADRPAIYRAILDAALTAGGAACADLQLYDPRDGALHLAGKLKPDDWQGREGVELEIEDAADPRQS